MQTEFVGSRWWKVDFHTHTAASADAFQVAPALDDRAWLLAHVAKGVASIAPKRPLEAKLPPPKKGEDPNL